MPTVLGADTIGTETPATHRTLSPELENLTCAHDLKTLNHVKAFRLPGRAATFRHSSPLKGLRPRSLGSVMELQQPAWIFPQEAGHSSEDPRLE